MDHPKNLAGGEDSGAIIRYPFSKDRLLLTCGLAAALLFWAALDEHSDGFYTFLRVYVCGLSLIWAFAFHATDRPAWALAAFCSAILFNPLFKIELERGDWQPIDALSGCFFAWLALQPYASFKQKRWLPFVPAATVAAFLFLSSADFGQLYGAAPSNTMNVDENLTTSDMAATDSAANATDANMTMNAASPTLRDALSALGSGENPTESSATNFAGD